MDEFTDVIQEYFETQIKNDQQEKPERLGAHKKKSKDVGMTEEGAPRSRGPDSHRSGHTRWDWGRKISPTLRSKLAYILLGSHSELLPALLASLVIHIVLIIWSIFHDMTFRFKYTDIDYHVFSDAARFVRNGCSPYERYTYRYSPIIAYLLYPNGITKELWGKFLFSGCNLVTGALLYDILKTIRGLNTRKALGFTYIWLLNPYIIVLATRGSSDSLTAAIICYLIRSMLKDGPTKKNAATFALAVSIRMYTIIYSIVFWLAISPRISEAVDKTEDISGIFNRARRYMRKIQPIFALRRTKWALTSALTFFAINGIFYYKYSDVFLHETFLYHIRRVDVKHNFSPIFYYLYLTFNANHSIISTIALSLPQALMTILIPLLIKDIILAAFCQTLFFVSTNKVSTAQYFMWYITFTPIVLSNLKLNKYTKCYGIALLSAWALLQYIWNRLSYRLEYLDEVHLFISLWLICLAFYLVNILILIFIMRNDEYNNYYVPSNTPETDRPYPVLKHSEDESSAIENMKKTQDITFGNLRYVHRKGRRGVELHTITKIDKWGIHKLFSTFSPVYLLVSIVSLAFLAFKALSTTLSKVIVVFLATVCLCCVVAISVDPIEASLLHIPNTGLMVRCSNSLRKSEKFIHSLETCSILVVERFYRFRITYGLIAVVKNDCIFYVDKLSEKKLSPQHASDLHLTQDDIYGHSTSCKLLSHDLDIIPLFPVSLSCMKFMVSIWRSLNVHPDKSVAPNAANVSECDVTKRLDSPPPQ